jgi:membrane-associated protein
LYEYLQLHGKHPPFGLFTPSITRSNHSFSWIIIVDAYGKISSAIGRYGAAKGSTSRSGSKFREDERGDQTAGARQTIGMDSSSWIEWVLQGMRYYGVYMFAFALLISAAGLPLPSTLFVIAAGAFARQGLFDWSLALALGLAGVVVGDGLSYAMGRYGGRWLRHRYQNTKPWRRAHATFHEKGGTAVFLTRCILTPLAIPTNLIAGSNKYPYRHFLAFGLAGELVWLLAYGAIGYAVGRRWVLITQHATFVTTLLAGIAIIAVVVWLYRHFSARSAKATRQDNQIFEDPPLAS